MTGLGRVPSGRDSAAHAAGDHAELGEVDWLRDLTEGERLARESGKPIFLLFQEVPGCSTCVKFGRNVLSGPLMVEAIETEFVPIAIFNNEGGADRAALERFGEPAWNNPVVRFVDAGGRDLLPRRDRLWSRSAILERMLASLAAADREVPRYLEVAAQESRIDAAARATLAMHCFWQGEACVGDISGVVATRPGWLGGREVVEIRFDPARVTYEELLTQAKRRRCASRVFAHDDDQLRDARAVFGENATLERARASAAKPSDDKRHLRASAYVQVDLTPLQRTRVNSALAAGEDPRKWLSPRQRASLDSP